MKDRFPGNAYEDIIGLCAVASINQIEAQGWSLNPGRYVGTEAHSVDDLEFVARLECLAEEFESLYKEAGRYTDAVRELMFRAIS